MYVKLCLWNSSKSLDRLKELIPFTLAKSADTFTSPPRPLIWGLFAILKIFNLDLSFSLISGFYLVSLAAHNSYLENLILEEAILG